MMLRAEIVTKLEAKSLIEPKTRPVTKPRAKPAIEPGAGLATKPGARPVEIEELLIFIASITIINVSLSRLHDLIGIYNNKKQVNYYINILQKTLS